jgi:hypothetical protein
MQIHAIATDAKPTAIEAAILSLPANVRRLAAAADLQLVGKLTVAQVDAKLAAATRLTNTDRLTIKIGLNRAGLLVD